MDAFDDAFGESETSAVPKSNGNGLVENESDPAAEFLAREQSNFADLEDEILDVPAGTNGDLSNGNGITEDLDTFSTHEINNGIGNSEEFSSHDRQPSPLSSSPPQTIFIQREEPEKIRIWREEQKMRLEVKGVHVPNLKKYVVCS